MRTTRFRISGGAGGGGIPGDCPPTVTFVDSLAVTDDLTVKWILPFLDTFGMTEDALGVKVELYDTAGLADALLVVAKGYFGDTFGMDDRLTLADINAFFLDTFGMDDALTAKIVATYVDTLGIDDRLTLATLKGFFADTFAVTENLGVEVSLPDTFAVTDDLKPVVKPMYADTFGIDDRLTLATVKPVHLDTLGIDDRLTFADLFANYLDTFGVADHFLGVKTALFDTVGTTENLIPTVKPIQLDTFAHDDAFTKAQFRNVTFGVTGTPDTNPSGDSWVDQASAGTNHGTEATGVIKGKSTLANDEQRALLEFDFTRYSNMTAFVGGTHQLVLTFRSDQPLLSVDVTMQLSRLAARPFTESTVNWTNQPAAGTVIKTETVTVAANDPDQVFTFTLTDAQMNDLLGDWGYVRLTATTAAVPPACHVHTREATLARRPRFDFDLKR